jgi:hypothetical protein
MKRVNQAISSSTKPTRAPQTQTRVDVKTRHKSPVAAKSRFFYIQWICATSLIIFCFLGQGNAKRSHESMTTYPSAPNRQGSTNRSPSKSIRTLTQSQNPLPWPTTNNFDLDGGDNKPVRAPEAAPGSLVNSSPFAWPFVPQLGVPSRAFQAPAFLERWFPEPLSAFPIDPTLGILPPSKVEDLSGTWLQKGASQMRADTPPNINIRRLEDAKRIQLRLIELGFLSGTADGIWGPHARGALKAFRVANGLGQDDGWDAITEKRMFGDTKEIADRAELMGFAGRWAPNLRGCHSGAKAPLTITVETARTSGGVCKFGSVQRNADEWRVQAICTAGKKSWSSGIRLMPKGNRLTWSNERVTEAFVRCSG